MQDDEVSLSLDPSSDESKIARRAYPVIGFFPELDAHVERFNFDPSIMRDIYYPWWNIPPMAPVLSVHCNPQASK